MRLSLSSITRYFAALMLLASLTFANVAFAQDTPVVEPPAKTEPAKTEPAKTDPAATPDDKPAPVPAATAPATTADTAQKSGSSPATKLTPEQEKELQGMQMAMARMKMKEAELSLRLLQMQVEAKALDLAAANRGIIEMSAQDEVNGVYQFTLPVTQESVHKAISDLNKLSRRMTDPRKGDKMPLTIVLDSPGGDVLAGLALYDHIRDLSKAGHHMTVKVRGMAASMGSILLQAGDTRVIGENAHVLIHEVSSGTHGKVSEQREQLAFSEKLWDKLATILAKKSKMKVEEIKDKANKVDWWLTAEEAVQFGFADKID